MARFLNFMKRKKWFNQSEFDGPLKFHSDTASTSLDDATELDEAPWRASLFLPNGCIEEKDWWRSSHHDVPLEETTITESSEPTSLGRDMSAQTQNNGDSILAEELPDQDKTTQQFHNCGLEVWEQSRDAWRRGGVSQDEEEGEEIVMRSSSPAKPLTHSMRRSIVCGLTKQREYNLPRRVRLGEMIEVYQQIWHEDSE